MENVGQLTDLAWAIRRSLELENVTGENGEEIDHIELYGAPSSSDADSKNFVLCPGGAYDRSPCGTGTSAKIACL
jgi:4-hydroxyproline epimerase